MRSCIFLERHPTDATIELSLRCSWSQSEVGEYSRNEKRNNHTYDKREKKSIIKKDKVISKNRKVIFKKRATKSLQKQRKIVCDLNFYVYKINLQVWSRP